jgi:phosphomannomutase
VTQPAASTPTGSAAEYRCPDEAHPISRAVHLGRLAVFYPACRRCARHDDTAGLAPRQLKRLIETRDRGQARPLFGQEGAAGVYLNDLGPMEARRLAEALGMHLRCDGGAGVSPAGPGEHAERRQPNVVIAGDGRPLAPELVAAASEGFRWTGCGVIDVGQATAPCVALAIDRLAAAGGILIGNAPGRPETVSVKFWADGPRPVSAGATLDRLQRLFESRADRPTRRFGPLRRCVVEPEYLAGLAGYYHALRPLRLVLSTTSPPAAAYLDKLTRATACEVLPCPALPHRLAREVPGQRAHLGIAIADDGDSAEVFDEQGRPVAADRLLLLAARHILADRPGATIAVESGTSPHLARRIAELGGRVSVSGLLRSEMDQAMRAGGAVLGAGPNGRLWHSLGDGPPVPDALMTLTLLLRILSRSDRPFSAVLDSDAAPA